MSHRPETSPMKCDKGQILFHLLYVLLLHKLDSTKPVECSFCNYINFNYDEKNHAFMIESLLTKLTFVLFLRSISMVNPPDILCLFVILKDYLDIIFPSRVPSFTKICREATMHKCYITLKTC